jgi:hypothetical protein
VKQYRIDQLALGLIGLGLGYAVTIFAAEYLRGTSMGPWVWDRHQNVFSWYSRPLFILPAAYYAYHRKIGYIIGFMLLMATSLFWFAAPIHVPEAVSGYLEWEKQMFFSNENRLPMFGLIAAVLVFLILLFYAFWQRNAWCGVLVVNFGTLLKIGVSLMFGGDAGWAAVVPSISSLVCINAVAGFFWVRARHRD